MEQVEDCSDKRQPSCTAALTCMISDVFQTRNAMLAILEDLHEDDYFAIIVFDGSLDFWKKSLTKATKDNVADAMIYVKTFPLGGSKKT